MLNRVGGGRTRENLEGLGGDSCTGGSPEMGNPKGIKGRSFLRIGEILLGDKVCWRDVGAEVGFSRNFRAPGVVAWCLEAFRKENALRGHQGLRSSGIWRC